MKLKLIITTLMLSLFVIVSIQSQTLQSVDTSFFFIERTLTDDGSYTERGVFLKDTSSAEDFIFRRMNNYYTNLARLYVDSIYNRRDLRRDNKFLDSLNTNYFNLSNEEYKDYIKGDFFLRYNNKRYDCQVKEANNGNVILNITDSLFIPDEYVLDGRGRLFFRSEVDFELRSILSQDVRFFNQQYFRNEDIPFLEDQANNESILNEFRDLSFLGWFSDGTRIVIRRKKTTE